MKLAFSKAPEPWIEMSQSSPDSAHLYFSTGTRAPITHWTYRASTNGYIQEIVRRAWNSHDVQQTTSLLQSPVASQRTYRCISA
jgi:hypothetical protein